MSKALVTKLTADDPTDPSGFLLKELSGYTHHSAAECQTIYDQLVQRLKSTKPDVKYRTLRTIKYLLTNGSRDFRQLFQRNNNDIRALVGYRCEPDPLRGESIFLRVSAEAKETVHAIFNAPDASNAPNGANGKRFEGYSSNGSVSDASDSNGNASWGMPSNSAPCSSSNASSYRDEYSSGGSKYAGYGSSLPSSESGSSDRRSRVGRYSSGGSGLVGKLQSTATVIADVVSQQVKSNQFASNVLDRVSKHLPAGVANMRGSTNTERDYPSSSFHSFGSNGQYNAPSINDDRDNDRYNDSYRSSTSSFPATTNGAWGRPQQQQRPTVNGTATSLVSAQPVTITASSGDGALESKLVDQLTVASGVKTAPSAAELQHFITTAESLDLDKIAELLNEKLQSLQVFVTKMKALATIQHAIDQQSALGDVVFNYFNDHPQQLEQLESSTNTQVKNRATMLMQKLGLREAAAGSEQTSTAPTSTTTSPSKMESNQQATKLDLLNFASDEQPPSTTMPSQSDNLDLFAQLQQPTSLTPSTTTATSSAGFDFMGDVAANSSVPTASTPNNTHAATDDVDQMFGNLNVKQSTPDHSQQATATPAAASAGSFDFVQSSTPAKQPHSDLLSFADSSPSLMDQQQAISGHTDALSTLMASGKSSTAHLQQRQQQPQHFHSQPSQPFFVAAANSQTKPVHPTSNDPFADFMSNAGSTAQPAPQLPPQQQRQASNPGTNAGFNMLSPSHGTQQKPADSFSFLVDDMLK